MSFMSGYCTESERLKVTDAQCVLTRFVKFFMIFRQDFLRGRKSGKVSEALVFFSVCFSFTPTANARSQKFVTWLSMKLLSKVSKFGASLARLSVGLLFCFTYYARRYKVQR